MKYANEISEMLNAFSPEPLKIDEMNEFYCKDTMECRMSDKYNSPIEDIFDICRGQESDRKRAFLLLGHRGCGKSTELNWMSRGLAENGYQVKTIACSIDLDLLNIVHSDLLILMGEALLEIAEKLNCQIDKTVLENIMKFWNEGTETVVSLESRAAAMETAATAESPGILKNMLQIFAKIKADLKFNEETRTEYRRKLAGRSSEWIRMLNRVSLEISRKTGGKDPIIIFEDLDKLNPEDAWKVFYNYATVLSSMPFPVIYTFPIALSYDGKFSAMESCFVTKTLPMIKIATMKNQPVEEGIDVIRKIVGKRAKLELFDKDVLELLIQYTGGSLRDLFHAINSAAKRAERRDAKTISEEDAQKALEELKTSLTRRIEGKDYNFLAEIYSGNKELIQDKEMLLKMLMASVVLEYNGTRWHNVHPLVAKFLKEQGRIKE